MALKPQDLRLDDRDRVRASVWWKFSEAFMVCVVSKLQESDA